MTTSHLLGHPTHYKRYVTDPIIARQLLSPYSRVPALHPSVLSHVIFISDLDLLCLLRPQDIFNFLSDFVKVQCAVGYDQWVMNVGIAILTVARLATSNLLAGNDQRSEPKAR